MTDIKSCCEAFTEYLFPSSRTSCENNAKIQKNVEPSPNVRATLSSCLPSEFQNCCPVGWCSA